MAKKANNEGSVFRDKSGRWRGAVTIYTADGKQKKKCFYGKTKREVTEKVNKMVNELKTNTYVEPSTLTLADWMRTWLNTYCRNEVRASTLVNYEIYVDRHIAPRIGNIRLCDVNAIVFQQFFNDRQKNGRLNGQGGLSPKTIKNMYDMVHRCLDQAVKLEMISRNPTDAVVLPKRVKQERKYLSIADQQKLQNCLEGEWMRMPILLDLYTGLRQGELLGLMWKDVHLEEETPYLRVTQTLNRLKNYGENKDKKTLLEIGYPKTPHSIRSIPLLPYIAEELRKYKQAQTEYLRENGITPNGYVFMNREGNWIDPRDFQRSFKSILKKNGIPELNVHGLRHTFATRALESGMSPKTLSKILGHSSVGFTLDTYAHVSDALMHDEMANLEGFL